MNAKSKSDMPGLPDKTVPVRKLFGIDSDLCARCAGIDPDYLFDRATTLAILAAFAHNRRVMVSGYHGTGKSTHIEQVAARLNWPCVRVNLDSTCQPYRPRRQGRHRRPGRQAGHRVPRRHPALGLPAQCRARLRRIRRRPPGRDVRDPARAGISGKLTLLDQSRVIRPHPAFRLFATANTVGLGDTTGLYHGTQQINQAQMDRWSIVTTLNYLPHDKEVEIVLAKAKHYKDARRAARSCPTWSGSPT
jgi:cobaltochelatase CobS